MRARVEERIELDVLERAALDRIEREQGETGVPQAGANASACAVLARGFLVGVQSA